MNEVRSPIDSLPLAEAGASAGNFWLRMLTAESPAAWRCWGFALLGATAALITVRLLIGCPIIGYNLQDSLWFLARAEQLVQGQAPHHDYFAFHGPAPFLLAACGVLLVGCRGLAITVGFALLAPLAVAAGWFLARVRLPAVMAAACSFMLGVYLVSPASPGGLSGSYGLLYNRFGWVMLSLVAIQTGLPPREECSRRRKLLERVLLGAVLACLAFTKVNFFGAAVLLFAAGCACFPQTRRGSFIALASFLLGSVFFLAFLRFDVPAYLSNIRDRCEATSPGSRLEVLERILRLNFPFAALACVPLLLVARQMILRAVRERQLTKELRMAAMALATLAVGLIVCSMNEQDLGIPLIAVAAAALCEVAARERSVAGCDTKSGRSRDVLGRVAALAAFLPVIALDLAAVGLALQSKIQLRLHPAADAVFHSPVLHDFVVPARAGQATARKDIVQAIFDGQCLTPHYMLVYLNEGIDLLEPHAGPADRIFCMERNNFFPLALGLRYPAGDSPEHLLVADELAERTYPSAEKALRDVTLVMEPKVPFQVRSVQFFRKLFASILPAQFEKIGESQFWVLWRRKTAEATMAPAPREH